MNGQEMLQAYENISELTDQMLKAAQSSNWDLLIRLKKKLHGPVKKHCRRFKAGTACGAGASGKNSPDQENSCR